MIVGRIIRWVQEMILQKSVGGNRCGADHRLLLCCTVLPADPVRAASVLHTFQTSPSAAEDTKTMSESATAPNYIELCADIVSAYVSNNSVPAADLPVLLNSVYAALTRSVQGQQE